MCVCVSVRDIRTSNDVDSYQVLSAIAPATLIQWPLWSCCWCDTNRHYVTEFLNPSFCENG